MPHLHAAVQSQLFDDGIARGADLEGPAGQDPIYRYWLWRRWDDTKPVVLWVMFNPSVGNHLVDDRTLGRCLSFSQRWGFGSFEVVNLYALRSTEPWKVFDVADPVGPKNDARIVERVAAVPSVIVAWGKLIGPGYWPRVDRVLAAAAAAGRPLVCLGQTFEGYPKHPLYLAGDTARVPFRVRRSA